MRQLIVFFSIALFCLSCEQTPNKKLIQNQVIINIDSLYSEVSILKRSIEENQSEKNIKTAFCNARYAYKKVEYLSEYYFPTAAKSINGPAIQEFESEDSRIENPEGFQVIEPLLYPQYQLQNKKELIHQIAVLESNIGRLRSLTVNAELTDAHIFDALRLEVYRIITLGITGFDSPIAQKSLKEAAYALEGMRESLAFYQKNIPSKDETLLIEVFQLIEKMKTHLSNSSDFNSFNRATFITELANPLSKKCYLIQKALLIPDFQETRPLKNTATTIFDENAFDADAFTAFPEYKTTVPRISLGKQLFYEVLFSGNNTRSCASCHQESKAFTDGEVTSMSLDGKSRIKRNTPTILNAAFQRTLFYDSRVNYLEDQASDVIANEAEMHGSIKKTIESIKKMPIYQEAFKKAYPKDSISEFLVKNALAIYMRSLGKLNSRFDKYMRGNKAALSPQEINGFNIFAGKGKCATCHFIPLTNGTVPPNFSKSESEVLGVPDKNNRMDSDLGKYYLTKATIHRNSFKTPTLRNINLTAPYMHNGVFKSLEEVIDFYNKGGGWGLHFKMENQTLPQEALKLTSDEKKALILFLKAL